MSRYVYAPGLDQAPATGLPNASFRPGQGAGGVFAGYMQGSTPKYAINAGYRRDLFRNTLARLFVRVDASEMPLFAASVGDSHTRQQLVPRLAGDPRSRRTNTNGYLDFLLQNVQMPLQEKMQVDDTLSDNYVAYAFGQAPPVWVFSGTLINSVQDDQASNFFRIYTQILRATQLARRQKVVSLSFDSYTITGATMNLTMGLNAQNELIVPFSMQILVKRVFISNYTRGWVPTRAGTVFAADLYAVPYDGRPEPSGALVRLTARTTSGTVQLTPTPQNQANPNVETEPGSTTGTSVPTNGPAAAPLITNAPVVPINPANTVQTPGQPQTAQPPGISSNASTHPGTPVAGPNFTPGPLTTATPDFTPGPVSLPLGL